MSLLCEYSQSRKHSGASHREKSESVAASLAEELMYVSDLREILGRLDTEIKSGF